jgi:hypothetical protein
MAAKINRIVPETPAESHHAAGINEQSIRFFVSIVFSFGMDFRAASISGFST